jgi:hypothetical protein
MKQFIPEVSGIEAVSALERVSCSPAAGDYPSYIELDAHKQNIVWAVAKAGRGDFESRGEIANKSKAIIKRMSG